MALDLNQFKLDLKTEFSNSPDAALKATTDQFWEKLAEKIDAYIRTGEVNDVTVDNSGNQNNVSNIQ